MEKAEVQMMHDIIISIHPQHVKNIFDGKKTIELRKNIPKCEFPLKMIIYETKNNNGSGMVVGEFVCKWYRKLKGFELASIYAARIAKCAAVSHSELCDYGRDTGIFALNISNPTYYDIPKPITDYGLSRPPQSWQYLRSVEHSE